MTNARLCFKLITAHSTCLFKGLEEGASCSLRVFFYRGNLMPVYSFRCKECDHKITELCRIDECNKTIKCEECGGVMKHVIDCVPAFLWEPDLDDSWYYKHEAEGLYD